jgi:hypothetical protein
MRHLHWLTCSLARTFIIWIASTVLLVDGIVWSVAPATDPDSENCEDQVPSFCESYGICNAFNPTFGGDGKVATRIGSRIEDSSSEGK